MIGPSRHHGAASRNLYVFGVRMRQMPAASEEKYWLHVCENTFAPASPGNSATAAKDFLIDASTAGTLCAASGLAFIISAQ